MTQFVASHAHADQALTVYLEPHADQRHVLLLGEAEGTLALRLADTAGRLEIIDPRTRAPSRGKVPELPFDDASFELVIVADAGALPEPRVEALRELKRVLSDDGLLALCSPLRGGGGGDDRRRRRGGSPQSALEQQLASEFRFVRVFDQTPLAGYALGASDAAGDAEFSIDSSLVRGERERLERCVGFASDQRLRLEPKLWVQVPVGPAPEAAARPDPEIVESLRRAEDDAREALRREAELLRELESERRARSQAEQLSERAKLFERKLIAAEADYDDAVARVRYLETELAERESGGEQERSLRERAERELGQAKAEAVAAQAKLGALERERDDQRADMQAISGENAELEKRLAEVGRELLEHERDKKQADVAARDLLEELRRLEQDKSAAVEHDARVAELEAERERAIQRALEAEVARESAQMRADELRAQLGQGVPQAQLEAERAAARGERTGLALRLAEAETALRARGTVSQVDVQQTALLEERSAEIARMTRRAQEAEDRAGLLEGDVERLTARAREADRVVDLEVELDRMDHRLQELTRELDEADRAAEAHADESERLERLEAELLVVRRRSDEVEDDLRATQDELRAAQDVLRVAQDALRNARGDADNAAVEASARLELAQRREQDARSERDATLSALAEARSILAQLASRVGADAENPPSIVQALVERERQPDEVASLRASLDEREQRLSEVGRELEARDERIRQLERNLEALLRGTVPPPPLSGPEAPETD